MRAGRFLLGIFMTVLMAQHAPADEVDATLQLWGWWLCGESGMAFVQFWPKVDHHHNTDCQQDEDSNDDGEQGQPDPWTWFPGPAQQLWKLLLGLLPC